MVECFENLGNILRDWVKVKVQKGLTILEQSVGSRTKLNQAQNWSW